jgi:hypothetical protein
MTNLSASLRLVESAAAQRSGADDLFRLSLVVARAAGEPVAAIAAAARLSTTRTSELLDSAVAKPKTLTPDEVAFMLERAFDVVLVPAGQLALGDYLDLSVYVCQGGRTFRDARWIGFYAAAEIYPRIPKIRRVVDRVHLTVEDVSRLRAAGDDELADVVEAFATAPDRRGHRGGPHKVMLLTPPEDLETIKLPQPIMHLIRGRGQAFVRRQRYTTVAALKREPATTAELLRYERE